MRQALDRRQLWRAQVPTPVKRPRESVSTGLAEGNCTRRRGTGTRSPLRRVRTSTTTPTRATPGMDRSSRMRLANTATTHTSLCTSPGLWVGLLASCTVSPTTSLALGYACERLQAAPPLERSRDCAAYDSGASCRIGMQNPKSANTAAKTRRLSSFLERAARKSSRFG